MTSVLSTPHLTDFYIKEFSGNIDPLHDTLMCQIPSETQPVWGLNTTRELPCTMYRVSYTMHAALYSSSFSGWNPMKCQFPSYGWLQSQPPRSWGQGACLPHTRPVLKASTRQGQIWVYLKEISKVNKISK